MDTTLNLTQTSATDTGTEQYISQLLNLIKVVSVFVIVYGITLVSLPKLLPLLAAISQYVVITADCLNFRCKVYVDTADIIDTVVHNKTPGATKLDSDNGQASKYKVVSGSITRVPWLMTGNFITSLIIDVFQKNEKSRNTELISIRNFKIGRTGPVAESESAMHLLAKIFTNATPVSVEPAAEKISSLAVGVETTAVSSKEVAATEAREHIPAIDAVVDFLGGSSDDLEDKDDNCRKIASVSGAIEGRANDGEDGWMDLANQ